MSPFITSVVMMLPVKTEVAFSFGAHVDGNYRLDLATGRVAQTHRASQKSDPDSCTFWSGPPVPAGLDLGTTTSTKQGEGEDQNVQQGRAHKRREAPKAGGQEPAAVQLATLFCK